MERIVGEGQIIMLQKFEVCNRVTDVTQFSLFFL